MHPYRIAGLVLGALALLFGGFMIIGLLLPGGWSAEREIWVDASPEVIFPSISRAARWGDWTPTPDSGVELFGPEAGAGSGRRWDDPGYGEGEFVITAADPPHEIFYQVDVEGGAIRIEGRLQLDVVEGGTRVQWREEGSFGWNPLLGYLAIRMNELQGAQLEASLAALKLQIELASRTTIELD